MTNEQPEPFKKGDAVQHKTGGPKMIFVGPGQYEDALCTWMANGKKQSDTFAFEELELFETKAPFVGVLRG